MALKDSVETNIVGSILEVKKWNIFDWVHVGIRLIILGSYILLQSIISFKITVLEFLVASHFSKLILSVNAALWTCIPFFGKHGKRLLPKLLFSIEKKLIPTFQKISQLIQQLFQIHLVEMTLKTNKNVHIFFTAESDKLELFDEEGGLKTTLLLANHRSINDYILINYLIQKCDEQTLLPEKKREILKKFWSDGRSPIPKLNFITWGKIVNFPHLSLMKNILIKDENAFVIPSKIKDHLTNSGNQVLTIFPEVNVMTTELSIVQRKLNQDYPFVAKFYNVLYPRFRSFISTIRCFAYINDVKTREERSMLGTARVFFSNGVNRLFIKAAPHTRNTIEQENAQACMVMGISSSDDYIHMTSEDAESKDNPTKVKQKLTISQNLYDLTIVYYKPRYTNVGHDHVDGQFSIYDGYQLEQVNPSILEMLHPSKDLSGCDENYRNSKPPIVIMIHIKKHELGPLLPNKSRNLEKWLENQWFEKERMINSMENGIKIK